MLLIVCDLAFIRKVTVRREKYEMYVWKYSSLLTSGMEKGPQVLEYKILLGARVRILGLFGLLL